MAPTGSTLRAPLLDSTQAQAEQASIWPPTQALCVAESCAPLVVPSAQEQLPACSAFVGGPCPAPPQRQDFEGSCGAMYMWAQMGIMHMWGHDKFVIGRNAADWQLQFRAGCC